jgi:hypothetical protein
MGKRRQNWFGPRFRIPKRAFPKDLARIAFERWPNIVGGDYVVPPCPPKLLLKELLEVVCLTATAPEEGRFPSFNIVAIPAGAPDENRNLGQQWAFDESRPLSISELRRLAPAVDLKKSAIWLEWTEDGWRIAGLVDLGTSWHRARMGLEYQYRQPSCLLVQVDRPGRVRVYQGGYHVVTLTDGEISGHEGLQIQATLGTAAHRGLAEIHREVTVPSVEEPKEYFEFEFLALWNTYAAIANSIASLGHGGALIVVPPKKVPKLKNLKIKYPHNSSGLRSSFIEFINARNVVGDLVARRENNEAISDENFSHVKWLAVLPTRSLSRRHVL